MPKTKPTLDELAKVNPKINVEQIAKVGELAKKLDEIPAGRQRLPSPITRRRIVIGENVQSDPRTIRLSTHR